MRSMTARPRDPSPSRLAYRMNRLWLTPAFHRALRLGLPLAGLVAAVVWWLGDGTRIQAAMDLAADARLSFEERPEFMVRMVAIEGATEDLDGAVRLALPLNLPVSSFHLDLGALKTEVEGLDAVESADLRVRPGGILQVDIVERSPAILWRDRDGLILLDKAGHRVATVTDRAGFPELPVIAGEGGDRAVPEALALVAAAQPIIDRVRGLERVGERRWDVVLDRDQRILLPERDSITTLDRLMALHQVRDILARDIARVDLRTPHRPTLQLNHHAMADLIRIRNPETDGAPE